MEFLVFLIDNEFCVAIKVRSSTIDEIHLMR